LILPFPLEDDIQLLVGLVGVQESAALTGDQRLETQFAACRADGLANRDSSSSRSLFEDETDKMAIASSK